MIYHTIYIYILTVAIITYIYIINLICCNIYIYEYILRLFFNIHKILYNVLINAYYKHIYI